MFDGWPGPATDAAAGETQLFEQVFIKGITDVADPVQGVAVVDLNQDGKPDLVLVQKDRIRVMLNKGNFQFEEHPIQLEGEVTGNQAPTFADFNGDGYLDFYLSTVAARNHANFFLSQGAWDKFKDCAVAMGVDNPRAYARGQVSVGDVNGDGDLDLVRAAHNEGGFRFADATDKVGLGPLNWFVDQWHEFWGCPMPPDRRGNQTAPRGSVPKPKGSERFALKDHLLYFGNSVLADFNNDGWLDLFQVTRFGGQGDIRGKWRSNLFMNRGDGTFELVKTELSGVKGPAILHAVPATRIGYLCLNRRSEDREREDAHAKHHSFSRRSDPRDCHNHLCRRTGRSRSDPRGSRGAEVPGVGLWQEDAGRHFGWKQCRVRTESLW